MKTKTTRHYMAILMAALACLAVLVGCTQQERAKSWGGSAEISLPVNSKLVTVTWKESDLWYLVRPMKEGETAESYELKESSSFGMIEGSVILKESKTK